VTFFLGWQIHPATGWGTYGTHLASGLIARRRSTVALNIGEIEQYPPLTRMRLAHVGDWSKMQESVKDIRVQTALVALGNKGSGSELPERVKADRVSAAIFFEDTEFTPERVAHLNSFACVVAGSTWNADLLRAKGVERVVRVIQGVDPTYWHPAPRDPAFPGRFAIFSGGKLEFRKGQDLVVAAFRKFRLRHSDALLVTAWQNIWPDTMQGIHLAGHVHGLPVKKGPQIDVSSWLEKNGIPRTAAIDVGFVPNSQMPQIVRACDVAVFPNRAEGGTNLVAMECIAAGVPTIAAMNTGQLDLRDYVSPLNEQRAVPTGCELYAETEGWGESSVDEIVERLEEAYRLRGARNPWASEALLAVHSWQGHAIPELLAAVDAPAEEKAA